MTRRLKENFLDHYKGFPSGSQASSLEAYREAMYDYANLVPEFGYYEEDVESQDGSIVTLVTTPTQRAVEQVSSLFLRKNEESNELELRNEKVLDRKLRAAIIAIRAKISQIEKSRLWLTRKAEFETAEEIRVSELRESLRANKKPMLKEARRRSWQSAEPEDFRYSRRNLPKVAQYVFAHPTNYLIIGDEQDTREEKTFNQMIFDPELISDRQLQNLGIDVYDPGRRYSYEDRIARRAEAIPAIKRELPANRTMGIWSIADGFASNRLFAAEDGRVLGTTNISIHGKPKKATIYKTTLKDAERRCENIALNQEKETQLLLHLLDGIFKYDQALSTDWQAIKNTEELNEVMSNIADFVNKLGRVSNPLKVAAKRLLDQSIRLGTLYHKRVIMPDGTTEYEHRIQLNPVAKRNQLQAAYRRLKERLTKELAQTIQYNQHDQLILKRETELHEMQPFVEVLESLRAKAERISEEQKEHVLTAEQKEDADKRLKEIYRKFKSMILPAQMLEPYRFFVRTIHQDLARGRKMLAREECKTKDLQLITAHMIGVLTGYKAWQKWEAIYDQFLAYSQVPNFATMSDSLEKFIKEYEGKDVKTDVSGYYIAECLRIADDMKDACQRGVEENEKPEPDTKYLAALSKELKNKMRSINLVNVINAAKR